MDVESNSVLFATAVIRVVDFPTAILDEMTNKLKCFGLPLFFIPAMECNGKQTYPHLLNLSSPFFHITVSFYSEMCILFLLEKVMLLFTLYSLRVFVSPQSLLYQSFNFP